jgi:hypothetical protein
MPLNVAFDLWPTDTLCPLSFVMHTLLALFYCQFPSVNKLNYVGICHVYCYNNSEVIGCHISHHTIHMYKKKRELKQIMKIFISTS